MYAEGEGVPQDFVLALMWFTLSGAQNHKDAIENRDKAVLFMTPAQIAEARKLGRRLEVSNRRLAEAARPVGQLAMKADRNPRGQTGARLNR